VKNHSNNIKFVGHSLYGRQYRALWPGHLLSSSVHHPTQPDFSEKTILYLKAYCSVQCEKKRKKTTVRKKI
jgi:hypothetical protein